MEGVNKFKISKKFRGPRKETVRTDDTHERTHDSLMNEKL